MMELKDWLIVGATAVSPILAVQAQKFVELIRERKVRKLRLFNAVMGTRATRMSADHVKALNMIDLVFYGSKVFGIRRRTRTEQAVLDAWNEYLDHLNTGPAADNAVWASKAEDLFLELVFAMSRDLGFKFDRVQLKRGAYYPKGHWDFETESTAGRKAWLEVVEGKRALKMEITNIPTPVPQTQEKQRIPDVTK